MRARTEFLMWLSTGDAALDKPAYELRPVKFEIAVSYENINFIEFYKFTGSV